MGLFEARTYPSYLLDSIMLIHTRVSIVLARFNSITSLVIGVITLELSYIFFAVFVVDTERNGFYSFFTRLKDLKLR